MTTAKPLLLRFSDKEAVHAVTRATLMRMAKTLGLEEIQVVHLALARLRDEMIPAYPANTPKLSATEALQTSQK